MTALTQDMATRPAGARRAEPAVHGPRIGEDGAGDGAAVPMPPPVHPERPARAMVTPFARALSLLAAFGPHEPWLGTCELAARTGLPPSTVTRLAHSLVLLGYLHHAPARRRYRLAAPVLALGYGAIVNSDVQHAARERMRAFADEHRVHVNLSTRDRLDLVVLESCSSPHAGAVLNLHVGMRLDMVASPIGWALLAGLSAAERYYLLEHAQRRRLRDWQRLHRRCSEGISQVQQSGFCHASGEGGREGTIVAAPLRIEGQAPMVLACVGPVFQVTRTRVERELGPRLQALATALQPGAALQ